MNQLNFVPSTLYAPEIEENWLHFSTRLVLQLTARSPDFERVFFEPLTEAEFKEYHIDTSFNTLPSSVATQSVLNSLRATLILIGDVASR